MLRPSPNPLAAGRHCGHVGRAAVVDDADSGGRVDGGRAEGEGGGGGGDECQQQFVLVRGVRHARLSKRGVQRGGWRR